MSATLAATSRTPFTLSSLARQASIEIAIDTEYQEALTLSIQTTTRLSDRSLAVQVYHSIKIPAPSPELKSKALFSNAYSPYFKSATIRRPIVIDRDLSPGAMMIDLFQLKGVKRLSRQEGYRLVADSAAANKPIEPSKLRITMIGHFLTADMARMWGSSFYQSLFHPDDGKAPLKFSDGNVIGLTSARSQTYGSAPTVEFLQDEESGALYELQLETRDTMEVFGPGSLDNLCRSFLGLRKSSEISQDDKSCMQIVFKRKPQATYRYAILDAVNTLLLYERMKQLDAEIYQGVGVPIENIPALRATNGSRTNSFLQTMIRRHAAGSATLAKTKTLRELMRKGGRAAFSGTRGASRFGEATAFVHGGLCFSRTPTKFFHIAPGMLRDVDIRSCYTSQIEQIDLYVGRPVVWEPGKEPTTLSDAVAMLRTECDPDAWMIRCSGKFTNNYNCLIPSTRSAITTANYRKRKPRKELEIKRGQLYWGEVQSGVVTDATWRMIQAFPAEVREEYEKLKPDSIIFYPRRYVATDGQEFDRKCAEHGLDEVPWGSTLDWTTWTKITKERIDADYVSLKFPIREMARTLKERRQEARERYGKGSGLEQALKLQANTLYGVLCSPHFAAGNTVAANVITARGRATAFAMHLALNGMQVITDGCTYRRDQIPACTLAECLKLQPDYPLRRAEAGSPIPFLDPEEVPVDDQEFTAWLKTHARRFFDLGDTDDALPIETSDFEHKLHGGEASFDALATDGSSNYIAATRREGGWKIRKIAMRAYRKRSKSKIVPWVFEIYRRDKVRTLPPITSDDQLLKLREAKIKVKQFQRERNRSAILPLGFGTRTLATYKAIKRSAFLYRDERQQRIIGKRFKAFESENHTGLELLALRRHYRGRHSDSLTRLAEIVYQLIKSGKTDLSKALHLTSLSKKLQVTVEKRRSQKAYIKTKAWKTLAEQMDASLNHDGTTTAVVIPPRDQLGD